MRSDFITLHTPLTLETKGLIGRANLDKCKKGVRIINCARGGIIDPVALVDAINLGKVRRDSCSQGSGCRSSLSIIRSPRPLKRTWLFTARPSCFFVDATTVMMVFSSPIEAAVEPAKGFLLCSFFFVSRHGAFHAVFFFLPRFYIFFLSYFFIVFDVDAILSCCPFFSIISRTKVVSCGFFALVCYHKTRWPERRLTYIRASRLRPS